MQRWHLTAGLTGAALLAAMVAPRLAAFPLMAPTPPPPAPSAPLPSVSSHASGHLVVDARLDRTALLAGTSNERFLAVTVTADDEAATTAWQRRPVDVAVVLDASGSMAARGKIDNAKRAAKLLATAVGPDDTFSLVVFNDDATTVVPATRVDDPAAIHRAIDRVYEGGGTNLYAGLQRAAHEIEASGLRSDRSGAAVGQVVLLSDGNANIGVTDPDALSRRAAELAEQGITVSTVGLGLDYNEDLLARMGDLGGGSYDFVDEPTELESVFGAIFQRSASVVARNVAVNVSLPQGVELVEFIGWDATRTDAGWTIWMGDVYAGDSRKIVARVRVSGSAAGEHAAADEISVASVRADYHDLIEGRMSESHTTATATLTTDPATVDASLDADATEAATRAWGNWHMDKSTRAYARGDVKESQRLIAEGRRVLEAAAAQLQVPSLAEEAKDLRQLGTIYDSYEPSSNEGQRAIKGGKEMFRGRAR